MENALLPFVLFIFTIALLVINQLQQNRIRKYEEMRTEEKKQARLIMQMCLRYLITLATDNEDYEEAHRFKATLKTLED